MVTIQKRTTPFVLLLLLLALASFYTSGPAQTGQLTGAWQLQGGPGNGTLLFIDGYCTHTVYNQQSRKFESTRGGTFEWKNGQLAVQWEFDTQNRDGVGKSVSYPATIKNGQLSLSLNGRAETWKKTDEGKENLAGVWKITARMQDGKIVPIHSTGARKTLKILSGTRFQWAAINPETKEFFGTGGGTYSFANGKYTEHIEFFSRDSSRVGASLSFNGKLDNGDWHHSGLSSRGDSIYEVWSRTAQIRLQVK